MNPKGSEMENSTEEVTTESVSRLKKLRNALPDICKAIVVGVVLSLITASLVSVISDLWVWSGKHVFGFALGIFPWISWKVYPMIAVWRDA